MMIVGMIKYPDNSDHFHYFQKCKYCSYVECVSNNYVVDSKDNYLHTCTCQDCGYQWTQVHIYHFIYTSRSLHDARCKVCNHFGEYANHTYEYYVYDEETHNMKCTICLYESNGTHDFVYNPSLGKDECEDYGYVSE